MSIEKTVNNVLDTRQANFEEAVMQVANPSVEAVQAQAAQTPVVNTVVNANPMMDQGLVNSVADRVVEKLIPTLKPAPMTVNEFGNGETKDETELTIERLAKEMYIK